MIEMSSGISASTMGIGVSHGTGGNDGVTSGCRLRAQSQSQSSSSQHANPQQSSQTSSQQSSQQSQQQQQQQQSQQSQQSQQQQQQQLQLQQSQQQQTPTSQQQQAQQRQGTRFIGRSKKDNCCLCWCCCCSCSWNKCLATVGGNTVGADGTSEQGKKKGNVGIGGEHVGGGLGGDHSGVTAGNGLDNFDGLDGLDASMECCNFEEVKSWGSSFDKLMKNVAGRKLFREFLRSEYSEENIAFWLACEELKRESNPEKIEEKARFIYEDYISILSPKEVSLDSRVREIVNRNMVEPTPHTFDEAQLQIYTLMHRDSYPRFVNSAIYRRVARLSSGPPSPTSASEQQEHAGGKSKGKKGTT
ncbi:regulator of G-protein signaling 17-like isoform X1 [Polistes fuscatus]|uniref:regulator of G-protein signaling 17-like isoform X1 n=1 Tax=Polistes fuscatus TaxID=30207 RepID=UPI001CA911FD|nr:regulator of G-protein signaling 17-like isoform X1 [Polistes fuscatus]XP_043490348.1 regulator of G-protein signaling 17-like isoform X1 [Polistes fuscatus]XP_043490349.1 regulator of G-protein signaling 17-like isoform X1 [Polistes fuscatus]XP_043490350.1 regulator of G-protein signaling 17-like isoform X1 [Polistes fuscatus]